MKIRATEERDWMILKKIRLESLLDTPTAFGVSYQTATTNSDEQWQNRASPKALPKFWLAFKDDNEVGIIGSGIDQADRYNLIAMWVKPGARGLGIAKHLVDAVKSDAISKKFKKVFLDVSPENLKAVQFYKKNGFVFIDEKQPLDSHPSIMIQSMEWQST